MRQDKKLLNVVQQHTEADQDVIYNVILCFPFSNEKQ